MQLVVNAKGSFTAECQVAAREALGPAVSDEQLRQALLSAAEAELAGKPSSAADDERLLQVWQSDSPFCRSSWYAVAQGCSVLCTHPWMDESFCSVALNRSPAAKPVAVDRPLDGAATASCSGVQAGKEASVAASNCKVSEAAQQAAACCRNVMHRLPAAGWERHYNSALVTAISHLQLCIKVEGAVKVSQQECGMSKPECKHRRGGNQAATDALPPPPNSCSRNSFLFTLPIALRGMAGTTLSSAGSW